MREKNRLDRLIGGVRDIENALEDAIELITLGEEEKILISLPKLRPA